MNERMSEEYTIIPNDVLEFLYGTKELPVWAIKYALFLLRYRNTQKQHDLEGLAWPSTKRAKQEVSIHSNYIKHARNVLENIGLVKSRKGRSGKIYVEFNFDVSSYNKDFTITKPNRSINSGYSQNHQQVILPEVSTVDEQRELSYDNISKDNYITPTAAFANAQADFNSHSVKQTEHSEVDATLVEGSNNTKTESSTVDTSKLNTWMVPLEDLFN